MAPFCYNERNEAGFRRVKGVKRMGKVACPACGASDLDVCRYDTMLVVRSDLALFTLTCPTCGASVSTLQHIPLQLREEVRFAAIEVDAGMMGR